MLHRNLGLIRRSLSHAWFYLAIAGIFAFWSSIASATITQGDFSVFGKLETRWSGRWGEGSTQGGTDTTFAGTPPSSVSSFGTAPSESGGSFDFNRWDLVQARSLADIRPDYHIVKNYNLLGRIDTLVLKDADVFAIYQPWYDAIGDIKKTGRAEPGRDWTSFTDRDITQQFKRDTLREYYAQLNFTDNFSMRVGQQQIIWSEADALSGTEVTNTADLRYHWIFAEAAEDQRKNLQMVKWNYILPDFLKTANNEVEAFWIPGDWTPDSAQGVVVNSVDSRSPYIVPAPNATGNLTNFNAEGQPYRQQNFGDIGATPLTPVAGAPFFFQSQLWSTRNNTVSKSLDNSEFGVRYSTLLPVGNGLQASFIYLYEARVGKLGFCTTCTTGAFPRSAVDPTGSTFVQAAPGIFVNTNMKTFVYGRNPNVPTLGTLRVILNKENPRTHWFGLTGTYYDKDLTDIVYRYDVLLAPKVGAANIANGLPGNASALAAGTSAVKWTSETRWIVAGDRPTYIPWISKQHTFIVAQNSLTWYPGRPDNAVPISSARGRLRELSDAFFLSAVNWLVNGQLVTTNTWFWDWDAQAGFVASNNSFRYSRNVLFGMNAYWYLGKSSRFTDAYADSRAQRFNETEVTFTYEI